MSEMMVLVSAEEYRQGIEAGARLQALRDILAHSQYPGRGLLMAVAGMPPAADKEVGPCVTGATHADAT